MTSELADTLLGLRWPLPRTDHDARAALDQLAQVSGRLTRLVAEPQVQQDAPAWLGPVQALIAQGGFTLDWWQPLLAEPDLDWTVNHQAHLSADLAQIAAAGARILDQLLPSGESAAPTPVVRSVASFGSVPMTAPPIAPPPPAPPSPQPPAPTGPPLLQPGTTVGAAATQALPPPRSEYQPPRYPPEPVRAAPPAVPAPPVLPPAPAPSLLPFELDEPNVMEFDEPDEFLSSSGSYDVSDPLNDSGRHRRFDFGPPPSTWRESHPQVPERVERAERARPPAPERAQRPLRPAQPAPPDLFPSHVQPYQDEDDDEDPILAPDRRLPAHAGMIIQATIVLCVVGALSWWAVGELHGSPSSGTSAGASKSPQALDPSAVGAAPAPTTATAADGLTTGGGVSPAPPAATTPAAQNPPPASGSATVSNMSVLLEGGSKDDPYIDIILTFAASNTDPVTITINYYGTSNGKRISPQTSLLHESGQTGYQVGTTIPSTAYCGTTVTVIASAGTSSSQAATQPGC